jgi:NitT/TauT family transport system substrate-binding protein
MKKLFMLFTIFIVIFSSAACSSDNSTKVDKDEKKTEKVTTVRLAEVTHSLFYAPLYVAIEKGFFEKQGLKVDLQTTWGGDKTMTTLLSGGADIALVGSETSIYVHNQKAKDPVINFAQLTQTDGTFLVSRKKLDHFNWSDLNGVTFLGQRTGGMPQMVGEFVLRNHGIDPHKDLKLIQNIDFANIANAFASGTGDYVQLFEPTASIFEKEGKGFIVASFGNESGKVPYTSFMSKESYIQENKETIEKFTKAIYEAQSWVDTHSAQEIADVVEPFFKETSNDISVSVIDRYKTQNSFATNPILDKDEWNNLLKIMKDAKAITEDVPYEALVDTTIANKVIK